MRSIFAFLVLTLPLVSGFSIIGPNVRSVMKTGSPQMQTLPSRRIRGSSERTTFLALDPRPLTPEEEYLGAAINVTFGLVWALSIVSIEHFFNKRAEEKMLAKRGSGKTSSADLATLSVKLENILNKTPDAVVENTDGPKP